MLSHMAASDELSLAIDEGCELLGMETFDVVRLMDQLVKKKLVWPGGNQALAGGHYQVYYLTEEGREFLHKTRNIPAHTQPSREAQSAPGLSEVQVKILASIAMLEDNPTASNDPEGMSSQFSAHMLSHSMQIPHTPLMYHIQRLQEAGLVYDEYLSPVGETYHLSKSGRSFLIENNFYLGLDQ